MTPILWSFRRCPFAMRARLALHGAQITVDHREILLRDKPAEMLAASPKGTVPVLQTRDGVIDESLDVMHWALAQNDPEGWLEFSADDAALIATNDGPFKQALDRTKYANRYPDADPDQARATAAALLHPLNDRLSHHPALTGPQDTMIDAALFPFVRQFAMIDRAWFDAQPWPHLATWLNRHLDSARFAAIMVKHPLYRAAEHGKPA
ncbi:glutathione S-transferase [Oceaniglobus ichthyenteri]|uniref:glutathione S-transferase n=1 Tax=Oceaniglobus ichthyenteri TaxID=2136177 RepID=UPI000D338C51|nr:glutathione S-transferase [Oceaniglobus ichthyenteri]